MEIGCIIVLYCPDILLLKKALNAVKDQVDCIFLVDNSTSNNYDVSDIIFNDKIIYHKMQKNIGIAGAQNIGIRYFLQNNYSHVIFLDQDSIIFPKTVTQLIQDLQSLQKASINVGGIGACPINRQNGEKYIKSLKKDKYLYDDIREVSEIMNSMSLIPIRNFLDVGLMEEELFIDGVDHEWCWRANKMKNFRFFISEKTFISHQLGEGDRFFVIRNVAISTPFRTYYQFRNYFILVRRNYVPIYWKVSNGLKYFVKLFYFPLFIKPRKEYLKNILKGTIDGISN